MSHPNDPATLPVTGFILAGGRSSRFGSNKVVAEWKGRPLLDYALQALRDAGIEPRVVTPDPEPLRHLAGDFVTDETPGKGPLEGVRAALEAATTPWSLILTADMPEVHPLVKILVELAPELDPPSAEVACWRDPEGRLQPFPGLYHRSLLTRWEDPSFRGSVMSLLDSARVRSVPVASRIDAADSDRIFRNVNEPRDLSPPDSRNPVDTPGGRS